MSSLWGSNRKQDLAEDRDNDAADDREQRHSTAIMQEPTERDRLLPANSHLPPHADGYLDPDDPAVSPYNLWTVRFLRYFTSLFLAITFVWWVLLFVSIFVSPPGLHTRGSGFFDFAYTTLTTGILLSSLLFFAAPSMAIRVSQGVLGVFLLVDLIIIVSVARIRAEEGAPGIASVVWAFLITGFCIITDRVVAWGKREEEERLTGRAETKRAVKEWLAVLASTVTSVLFIIISILMTATLIIRSLDAGLHMDGKRIAVDSGKYEVHLSCYGNNTKHHGVTSPTIILEAAEDPVEYDFERWAYGALENGTIDRYCSWDRPGYAWSDNAPSPHSAGMSADNLAEALAIEGEQGPWILVSSGYGSIVSRIFSARNRKQVVGIMLIDPLHEDLLPRIGDSTRGFVTWGWGVLSPLGIRRILGSMFGSMTREDRVYGNSAYLSGKYLKAKLQENLVATSLTKSEVSSAKTIQDLDTPLVVVSSGIKFRSDQEWADKQKNITGITGNLLSWDVVNKAPHKVWATLKGRQVLEKRLGQLVEASYNISSTRPLAEHEQQ